MSSRQQEELQLLRLVAEVDDTEDDPIEDLWDDKSSSKNLTLG